MSPTATATADERRERTIDALHKTGSDLAVLTSPEAVGYASGHAVPIQTGPSPFAGGPDTAVITRDGAVGLVVPNLEADSARSGYADTVVSYTGYTHRSAVPQMDNYLNACQQLLHELGAMAGAAKVAIEPGSYLRALHERFWSASEIRDITPALNRARATKTDRELTQLRRCAEITAIGQHAVRRLARPGRTELDVLAGVRRAWENAVGERLPTMGDLLSGVERTAQALGWPTTRALQLGDPVLADLVPRVAGYWGDSCNTVVVGEPSPGLLHLHDIVSRALQAGVDLLRPGVRACDVDAVVRQVIRDAGYEYRHHTGHGIGTGVHEYPRIVPEERGTIEAGMVLLLEPGAYDPAVGGVRLEWMFHVTDNGAERLSPFDHVLDLLDDPETDDMIAS